MNFNKTCLLTFAIGMVALLCIAPLSFAGMSKDTTFKEVKQETRDLVKVLKNYTSDQRDDAIEKTNAALDDLDEHIDELETRIDNNWDSMRKAARDKARANLKALRKMRIAVAEWYGSLKNSSADAWDHIIDGISDSFTVFHEAWEKAENEFESDK